MKHAKRSLQEAAADRIRDGFDQATGPKPRVLWWDEGGHLETVLDEACAEVGIEMTRADGNPLKLRERALSESDGPVLWYIPEAQGGREWFRDIAETGDEVNRSIWELAAEVYDANPWDILDPSAADEDRNAVAGVLLEELTRPQLRPSLQELQDTLVLGGHGSPLRRILQDGWDPSEADAETVDTLRNRLEEEGVPVLDSGDDANRLIEKVRRWAVAQSLVAAGVTSDAFPSPYDREPTPYGHGAHRILQDILSEGANELSDIYLDSYWEDVIEAVDDPWSLVDCAVEGALDQRLWTVWLNDWDEGGNFEKCLKRAKSRTRAIEQAHGVPSQGASDTFPWSQTWKQAADVADLALRLAGWTNSLGNISVHALYGNEADGTWRIDRAVRDLIVSGAPEDQLPVSHPAREHLPEIRNELVGQDYVDYLEQLAEETTTQLRTGELGTQLTGVRRFWEEHKETFASGPETVIFYLDALRLDLAYELAEELRSKDYQVKSNLWAGILPSETEFGMGVLTPGDPHTFEVDLVDGKLRALRNRNTVDTTTREKLLKNEGWSIAKDPDEGWEKPRVAYFDTEIDDIGETDLDAIEEKLATRVEQLAEFIATQIERGRWERAFVVADHGFVLLPENPTFEKISKPEGASDVSKRRAAGKNLDQQGAGVILDGDTPLTGHLGTSVQVLVNPLQRFRQRGVSDSHSRYYHGGALPQEFVLNFLRIERP